MDDIRIENLSLLPSALEPGSFIEDGFLAIAGSRITALGPMAGLDAARAAQRVIDGRGRLAIPGLVNGHGHAPMTLFRGLADDLPLMAWLTEHIFPAEARAVNPEMAYWCAKLAAAEMLLAGTTCTADGYFCEDAVARAFLEAGLRALPAQGVIDFPAPGVPDPKDNIGAAARFIDAWRNRSELVTPGVFCHSPYTCSAATLTGAKEMARAKKAPFFIHLAETGGEVERCRAEHGKSPARYLADLGLLDRETVCIHGVWLDAADTELLAAHDAAVVLCPESNMKLASGVPPADRLLARGLRVGLGTDGAASNNDLDLFAEMATCARLLKATRLDPTVLPANQALWMATGGGAAALGLGHEIGTLEPGKKADIVLLDLDVPHLTPFHGPDLLVYAARGSDTDTVLVNGRIVVEKGKLLTFDLAETMARVGELAAGLMAT